MLDVLRFWLDRGVDGFRVDVIWGIVKDDRLRDNPPNPAFRPGMSPYHALQATFSADQLLMVATQYRFQFGIVQMDRSPIRRAAQNPGFRPQTAPPGKQAIIKQRTESADVPLTREQTTKPLRLAVAMFIKTGGCNDGQ